MNLSVNHSMLAPEADILYQDQLLSILASVTDTKKNVKKPEPEIYWNQDYYGLNKSAIFSSLEDSKKDEVLQNLNQKSLCLSYFIEKFGLNYGAKMILNAESTEEKSLYSIFGADEVRHRLLLEPFIRVDLPTDIEFHPLLPVLALALKEANKDAMVFTIQVVLEGFGIFHYSNLRDSCRSPLLKNAFTEILKDEVNHHGMGICLTAHMNMSPETKAQITDLTAKFVRALIKAEWVLKSVEEAHGGFSQNQRQNFLEEISWNEQIHRRIERLKILMNKVGYKGLSEDLESLGVYKTV